jgi:hypothetical protein
MLSRQAKIKKEVADRLKQARINANYASIEEFCERNKLPLKIYLSHEQGKKTIPTSKAMNYSKLLGISLRRLMLG